MTITRDSAPLIRKQHGPTCRSSSFRPARGAEEVHLFIEPERDGSFEDQLEQVVAAYHAALESLNLPRQTAVFRRCLISDAANQLDRIMASPLGLGVPPGEEAAVSCIEQPPLHDRKLALLAYHVSDVRPEHKTLESMPGAGQYARTLCLRRGERTYLWTTQMTGAPNCDAVHRPLAQTHQLFGAYGAMLASHESTLLENAVRTWIFVQNVDTNYGGMVDARRELFLREGLTRETHYIVSTGIEGRTAQTDSVVTVDALAIQDLDPAQMIYVDSLDHLNRTDDYGVTFERAVRLEHGDRSHLYLAGTASIDAGGHVLHAGDIVGQTERTLENINALLAAGAASLDDIAAMTVYLRDGADASRVAALLEEYCPTVPYLTVRAPVCRPTWLIEIEVVAITAAKNPRWPLF